MKIRKARFSCVGKIKIKSIAAAKKAARRRDGRDWYFCENCHYYHTGTSIEP